MCQQPVVLAHVAERGADAALRRDRVRARREHLGEHRDGRGRPPTSCSAARRPAPPAPTTTTSKLRFASATPVSRESASPSRRTRPATGWSRPEREPQAGVLDVVHPDVAHADPGVDQDARDEEEGRELHPPVSEQRRPRRVAHRARPDGEEEHRVGDHQQRGDPLGEPVLEAVVRADDDALHHMRAAIEAVSARLTMKTAKALRLRHVQARADVDVEEQVADAGAHVVQQRPDRRDHQKLGDRIAQRFARLGVAALGRQASVEQVQKPIRPRNSSAPLTRWRIETRPGTGRLSGLRLNHSRTPFFSVRSGM